MNTQKILIKNQRGNLHLQEKIEIKKHTEDAGMKVKEEDGKIIVTRKRKR